MKNFKMNSVKKFMIMNIILLVMTNCSTRHKKLSFINYPGLKLGFTTQNFTECLPVSFENVIMLLDYAYEKGFTFFELRDPNAELTFEECSKIAGYASEKGIEVAYANQRGLLDPDFMNVFSKGVKNAKVFIGPKTIRATISGLNFTENPGKTGLSKEEFTKAIEIANQAAQEAEGQGIQLVIENGAERFTESNDSLFGFESFFKKVNPNVAWQFDTANPFANKDNFANPDSVKQYLEKHAGRIKYIHLKAAQNYQAQKVLGPNELDYGELFRILSANNVNYISIELFVESDIDTVYKNMDMSIEFLRKSGFIN